jgi:hypothetical protein
MILFQNFVLLGTKGVKNTLRCTTTMTLFSWWKVRIFLTVALSFVFDN